MVPNIDQFQIHHGTLGYPDRPGPGLGAGGLIDQGPAEKNGSSLLPDQVDKPIPVCHSGGQPGAGVGAGVENVDGIAPLAVVKLAVHDGIACQYRIPVPMDRPAEIFAPEDMDIAELIGGDGGL